MPFPCIKIEKDATITTNVTMYPHEFKESNYDFVVHDVQQV
jgi:hypothetical protein